MLKSTILGAVLAGVTVIGAAGCCHSRNACCDDCCSPASLQNVPMTEPGPTEAPPSPSNEDAPAPEDSAFHGITPSSFSLPKDADSDCCGK